FGQDDAFAEGVPGKIAACDGFTDNGDARRTLAVVARKKSAAELRNFHHAEIVVADHVEESKIFMPPFGFAFRMYVQNDGYAKHGQTAGRGDRTHSRQRRDAFADARIEGS